MKGTRKLIVATALMLLIGGEPLCADALILRGSAIPLRNVEILEIRSGRLYFDASGGRRQWRDLEEVMALSFDDFDELDQAEQALQEGQAEQGVLKLLQAALAAEDELPRLWTHVRLVRLHKARQEFIEAASHAAAVFALRPDDSYWRYLEPLGELNDASYPAVHEALQRLRGADRASLHRELRSSVDRLRRAIEPVARELAASWKGGEISAGQTLSGFSIAALGEGRLERLSGEAAAVEEPAGDGASPPGSGREPDVAQPPRSEPGRTSPRASSPPASPRSAAQAKQEESDEPTPAAPASPDSAEAIEELLEEGQHEEALEICRSLAERMGERSVSRFLHQYGRALAGAGHPKDAAVMFMRCAILHDRSSWAAASLLETGLIYRDVFRRKETARRLLDQAQAIAGSQGDSETVERARAALSDLDRR